MCGFTIAVNHVMWPRGLSLTMIPMRKEKEEKIQSMFFYSDGECPRRKYIMKATRLLRITRDLTLRICATPDIQDILSFLGKLKLGPLAHMFL